MEDEEITMNNDEVMFCIRCYKEIKPKENFIEVTEWNNQKLLLKNRCHKSCWLLFMDEKDTKRQALYLWTRKIQKDRHLVP